jgi:hypothetical protein
MDAVKQHGRSDTMIVAPYPLTARQQLLDVTEIGLSGDFVRRVHSAIQCSA